MTYRRAGIFLGVSLLLVAGGFLAGRALGEKQPAALAFDLNAVSYQAEPFPAAQTTAGFTGFEAGTGLDGASLLKGTVISSTVGMIVLDTGSGRQSIRITGNRSLRRFEAASPSALVPGARVIVLPGTAPGEARAILVVTTE